MHNIYLVTSCNLKLNRTYLISLAASNIALIVDDEVQLNAGSATSLSLQYCINFNRLSPVTTPGGTIPCNSGILISFKICSQVLRMVLRRLKVRIVLDEIL